MTLRSYLWGLNIGTLISFTALCAVIFLTDPEDIGNTAFVLFYATFFLTVSGMGILLLTGLWRRITQDNFMLGEMGMAIRQGVLIGVIATIVMGLQHAKILVWWLTLIVIAAIFLIELFFLTRSKKQ
jgi:hypothetical protein